MREILFRGKRIDNSEWVEGQLLYFKASVGTSEFALIVESCEWDNANKWFNLGKRAKVIPETVGQYTGLTDKHGKKIFEGDLLDGFEYPYISDTGEHNYFAEVVWFDNCPAFGLCTHKHPLSAVRGISEGNCEIIEDFDSSQWEVIGNIHDNPELLKGGEAE